MCTGLDCTGSILSRASLMSLSETQWNGAVLQMREEKLRSHVTIAGKYCTIPHSVASYDIQSGVNNLF
jgi:hypothetical protein